jgi:ribosome-binding protein aMBF1 (putative translation factor)
VPPNFGKIAARLPNARVPRKNVAREENWMQDIVSPRKPDDPPWRSRTAHRSLDPDVAAMLARARAELGWTYTKAAWWTGISRRMLSMLEAGQRVPSQVLAEDLITGYRLGAADAALLRAVALPDVGRASPYGARL